MSTTLQNNGTAEEITPYAILAFPPFPLITRSVINLEQFKHTGIWMASPGSIQDLNVIHAGQDAHGRTLANLAQGESAKCRDGLSRQHRRFINGGGPIQLPAADCFKLGQENSSWTEPEGTGRPESYDLSRPPFDRLLNATRDFLISRQEAFQTLRVKRLFDQMRNALGVRSDQPGQHWPGTGPNGQAYLTPNTLSRLQANMSIRDIPLDDEACVLLRHPVLCVRGYIAMMRREVEAGWEIGPSVKLAEILATYLAYINHYRVFTESPLAGQFETAAGLAMHGPKSLREAHAVEEAINEPKSFNQAVWTIWGGQYDGAERGGIGAEAHDWPTGVPDNDTGSWGWESGGTLNDKGPAPLDAEEVFPIVEPLLEPLARKSIRILGHIPYARRVITAILPPLDDPTATVFMRTLYRLVTSPAPWTDAEGWRRQTYPTSHASSDETQTAEIGSLELEIATVPEPEEMIIWVESGVLQDDKGGAINCVGMALRGRWGHFGSSTTNDTWWAFRGKDYTLPSIWLETHRS